MRFNHKERLMKKVLYCAALLLTLAWTFIVLAGIKL